MKKEYDRADMETWASIESSVRVWRENMTLGMNQVQISMKLETLVAILKLNILQIIMVAMRLLK